MKPIAIIPKKKPILMEVIGLDGGHKREINAGKDEKPPYYILEESIQC